jgi:hypothetical protein
MFFKYRCLQPWVREDILRGKRTLFRGYVKLKIKYYSLINTEYSGQILGLSAGNPDVRTSDKRHPLQNQNVIWEEIPSSSIYIMGAFYPPTKKWRGIWCLYW